MNDGRNLNKDIMQQGAKFECGLYYLMNVVYYSRLLSKYWVPNFLKIVFLSKNDVNF